MPDAAVTDESSSRGEDGWRPGRGALYAVVAATAVLGFGIGLVVSGGAGRLADDAQELATEPTAPSTTTSTTAARLSTTTSTTAAPTTTTTTAAPTTITTAAAPVTTTTAPPATVPVTTSSTAPVTLPPPTVPVTLPPTTTTTIPSPLPTSVPPGPPGSPAAMVVSYAGQSSGVLRLFPGRSTVVVWSNVGGAAGDWMLQASGAISVTGGNRLTGTLLPGASVGVTVTASAAASAGSGGAITFTFPNGSTVVPVVIV